MPNDGSRLIIPTSEARPHWNVRAWAEPVDPLRGAAALAVLFHHSVRQAFLDPHPLALMFGHPAVAIYFVISGFCIHLSQAQRQAHSAEVDWRRFFYRRARRLLPTHYTALMASVAAGLFFRSELINRPTLPNVVSHVLMVHVWYPRFFWSINEVFWTIAIEVHLYLVYPIFLRMRDTLDGYLPVALLIGGFAVYLAAAFALPSEWRWVGEHLFLEYWWQWALGAYLADVYVSGSARWWTGLATARGSWLWWASIVLAAGYLYRNTMLYPLGPDWFSPLPCFLLLASLLLKSEQVRIPWLAYVGTFSYSLYLIHPVAICLGLAALGGSHGIAPFICYIVSSIVAGWVFFLAVERHFLSNKQRRHQAEIADAMPTLAAT